MARYVKADDDAVAGRRGWRGGAAQGASGLARIIDLIALVVVGIIVVGILLVLLKANPANDIVKAVHDAAKFLAGPFDNLFKIHKHRTAIAVNWGIAAVVYLIAGRLIAGLLRR